MRHEDPRVARVIERYEALTRAGLPQLDELYRPEARFKDPFNEVQGLAAIRRIFEHMFDTLDTPRFVIRDAVAQHDQAFLTWDFHFRTRRRNAAAFTVHGATHLQFASDGRIVVHRDYWDAAEEVWEKVPLRGGLLRTLKKRLRA